MATLWQDLKVAFWEGYNDDEGGRESSTRKLVRHVTHTDHIGNIDAMRKIWRVKVTLSQKDQEEALRWLEEE